MTVLVSVPYFGCADYVEKAVRSILGQTYADLALVVVGDGEDPPLTGILDDRLVVYRLPQNHGAYFAQSVALEASPHQWYAPHGADDWSDPDHLEKLLALDKPAVATGAVWLHTNGNAPRIHYGAFEVGVFDTQRLRSFGGYNPSERMGQDSLLFHLLRLTGELYATSMPTYHRLKRPGSLTTSKETGHRTPARNAMRKRNREILGHCLPLGRNPAAIRAVRDAIVPTQVSEAVHRHAAELRALL